MLGRVDVNVHRYGANESERERLRECKRGKDGEREREREKKVERVSEKSDARWSFERGRKGKRALGAGGAARASLLIGPITVITESFGADYARE